MLTDTEPRKNKNMIRFVIALMVLGIVYFSYALLVPLLMPKEDHFTELYFETYPTLSQNDIVFGRKIAFSFTIRDLEGKDMDYPYQVYFKSVNKSTILIDSGVLILKNNEFKNITENYRVRENNQHGNIIVFLKNLNQEISFAVPAKN